MFPHLPSSFTRNVVAQAAVSWHSRDRRSEGGSVTATPTVHFTESTLLHIWTSMHNQPTPSASLEAKRSALAAPPHLNVQSTRVRSIARSAPRQMAKCFRLPSIRSCRTSRSPGVQDRLTHTCDNAPSSNRRVLNDKRRRNSQAALGPSRLRDQLLPVAANPGLKAY